MYDNNNINDKQKNKLKKVNILEYQKLKNENDELIEAMKNIEKNIKMKLSL